jgi:hypothetical protein
VVSAVILGVASSLVASGGVASANTSTVNDVPYTCTTNGFGNQNASYSATITDTIDPAAVGNSVTYRFVVPFGQAPPPVTASYRGGTTKYRIPAGLNVTSVSTPAKAGSNLTATASVQGDSVVVTSTGNQPIDGGTYPTPDLLVTGTITAAAAGPGVVWKTPYSIVANVHTDIVGDVIATCSPNDANVTIATTTVPAGPKAPVPVNQNLSIPSGAAKAITLFASDSDNTQAQLTYAIATPPAHGTLTGTAPSVTYQSDAGFVGNDSFTFTAKDPGGLTGTGTVNIKVFSANVVDNVPPVITLTSPQNGAVFTPGQVVNAAFSCTDATTAVEQCAGTAANGAPISTTVGQHTFAVDARDTAGNLARTTVSYRIVDTALVAQTYNAANQVPAVCSGVLSAQTIPVTVAAPTQVGTGRSLTMRFTPGAGSVPALRTRSNIVFTLAAPVNGTAVTASVVPNSGTANARASASATVTGGKAVLTIAGPIAGGTTAATAYTPPAMDVVITAGTTPNVDAQTQLAAYQETDIVSGVGQVPMTRSCTAGNPGGGQANPVLTRTRIIDTTPPTVTITGPAANQAVAVGAAVPAAFSCTDAIALATCVGSTPNGSAINTSTPGVKTLTVTATDQAGNIAQRLVSLRVVTVALPLRFESSQLPGVDGAAAYFGTDRVGLAKLATLTVLYYLAVQGPPETPYVPPANTGAVTISVVYTVAEAQAVASAAASVGMTAEQFQRFSVIVALYVYAVNS